MRAFVAVDPGAVLRAALADLAGEVPQGRAVPEENLHLTLAFLDEIDAGQAEALHDALEARALPGAVLEPSGLETWGAPGVLVIRVARDPGLLALQAAVAGAARGAGIALARRRFRPHVTLARYGRSGPGRLGPWLAARGAVRLPAVAASRVVFCRSDLHPAGARHTVMADYPLPLAKLPDSG